MLGIWETLLKRPVKQEGVPLPRVNVWGELCSSSAGHEAILRVLFLFARVKSDSRATGSMRQVGNKPADGSLRARQRWWRAWPSSCSA